MEPILKVLQGSSYAYLLIFQILLVSGLLLVLIGLLIRRSKQRWTEATTTAETAPAEPKAEPQAVVDNKEVEHLRLKIAALETEQKELEKLKTHLESLKQYNRDLNTKLAEYEIIQEELRHIGALKKENEELKKKLGVEGTAEKSAATTSPTQIPPELENLLTKIETEAAAPKPTSDQSASK